MNDKNGKLLPICLDDKDLINNMNTIEVMKDFSSEFEKKSANKIENTDNFKENENLSKLRSNEQTKNHIMYILVVGFHHKKGCQIDYCYPSLETSNCDNLDQSLDNSECSPTNKLPNIWKTLPSIALPDGAHNYDKDTIYFHLPHPKNHNKTVFGISCYRQISTDKLIEKTDDLTRGTVQKSVVVISEIPLYGLIAVKCEMVTFAYFNECDFSKIDCLKELYFNLNSLVKEDLLRTSEVFLDLSPRDLILIFFHKILILFKLILLEKKILFHSSPVKSLCTSILTLLSLFPGMIESGGLNHCSTKVQQKKVKNKYSSDIQLVEELLVIVSEDHYSSNQNSIMLVDEIGKNNISSFCNNHKLLQDYSENENLQNNKEPKEIDPFLKFKDGKISSTQFTLGDENYTPFLLKLSLKDCGFPLNIFQNGAYCHPYLSLAYLDIISDNRIKSFVIGATNHLFKQKRSLFDVIVEIEGAKIDIVDNDLKKKLQLSTEDLRFADYLVKCILENSCSKGDVSQKFFDGTSWEGGDEWLRYQFKIYLIQLMVTSKCSESSKEYNSFNPLFLNAWKTTNNYKSWLKLNLNTFKDIQPGHPFYGQLSLSDMKLKFNHAMNNTERGKKINQTVVQTGKAVGTAITSAKTAVYSWWSQLGTKNLLEQNKNLTTSSNLTDLISQNSNENKEQENNPIEVKPCDTFTTFTLSSLLENENLNYNEIIFEKSKKEDKVDM